MKEIAEQADALAKRLQIIADAIADYNPGLCKEKTPLDVIQYDIACLRKDLTFLYAEIGKKIKNEKDKIR